MFLFLVCTAFFTGCASPPARPLAGQSKTPRTGQVWLVSNGFHTSIAMRAKDAPPGLQMMDRKADYFVIGWGGRDLYMMRKVRPWQWITSTILPTASALHVIPVRGSLVAGCPNSEIIEFDVTMRGITRLHQRLKTALDRDENGRPLVAGPGKIPESRFLKGTEVYYLPKTCNLWVASNLKAAGVPIHVCTALLADNIIWQGRKHGRLLSTRRKPADPL